MGDERRQEKKKKSSLFGRLFKLVAFLALAAGVALVGGFKVQKEVRYDVTVERDGAKVTESRVIPAGKWAWEDKDGFIAYSKYWAGWTRERLGDLDRQVGGTDKVKAGAEAAKDGIKKGYDAVQDKLSQKPAAPGPDRAVLDAQEREAHHGYTEREIAQLPSGYYESYKAGHESFRQGYDAYQKWLRDRDNKFLRQDAEERLRTAKGHFEKAMELYPQDSRPSGELARINEYLHDISKQSGVDY